MNRLVSVLLVALSLWLSPAVKADTGSKIDFPFLGCFEIASRQHNVDLDLLLAVAFVESNWDPTARSARNAHGLMQVRWPVTARHLGSRRVAELYNPCLNIEMGARYLRELSDKYEQDDYLMLAAYNYGPSRIKKRSDVPKSVATYVDKVTRQRRWISAKLNSTSSKLLHEATRIELTRFDSSSRAKSFVASLQRLVPDIQLILSDDKLSRTKTIVLLDPSNLTPQSRYRIGVLIPGFQKENNP